MKSDYHILQGNKDNSSYTEAYHRFISTVFPGISFEPWQKAGFWTKDYLPYSIIQKGNIISNVSVSLMTVLVNGERLDAAQIGAVGTVPEYRKQGLSRLLINHVIDIYSKKSDLIFLFANDSVMDFYPKFGFIKILTRFE